MSAWLGSGALALWLDVAPELDGETDGWYIDEHMPERIDIGGYLRARRYVAIEGQPAYLTLFEAQTPAALASDGYLRLVSRISEQSQRIREGFSNVVRNTFAVRRSHGRGIGATVASLRLTPRDAAARRVTPRAARPSGWIPTSRTAIRSGSGASKARFTGSRRWWPRIATAPRSWCRSLRCMRRCARWGAS